MATSAGLYIILELHAAPGPGGQSPNQQFTRKSVKRGVLQLWNLRESILVVGLDHKRQTYTQHAIEIVDEPVPFTNGEKHNMFYEFYPNAWKRIWALEDGLKVSADSRLHIQMMDGR